MKLSTAPFLLAAAALAGSASASATPSEYKSVLEALEAAYGGAKNCKSHVNVFHWRTTTDCTRPGGTATLVSRGVTGWDRKPESLQVCELGDMNKPNCQEVTFTGSEEQDLLKAGQLLKGAARARYQRTLSTASAASSTTAGSSSNAEWNLIVRGLEALYQHQCTRHVVVLPPGPSTYILDCTHPGGTATFGGQASATDPSSIVPEYLKVCGIGAENRPDHCHQIEFTGDLPTFLSQAKQMLLPQK